MAELTRIRLESQPASGHASRATDATSWCCRTARSRLCGKHAREVYEYCSDLVTDRWDGAVRDYVSELHKTFKPPQIAKQPLAGWLYFVRFGDRVKIGYTTNPDRRLREIPHEQVIGIVPGERADEAAWHRLLSDYHVVGEWFRAEPELLATLARVAAERTA